MSEQYQRCSGGSYLPRCLLVSISSPFSSLVEYLFLSRVRRAAHSFYESIKCDFFLSRSFSSWYGVAMQGRWWAASCIPKECTEDVCGFYANFKNEIEYPDVTWTLDLCDSLSPASGIAPQMFQNCAGTAHMHASCVSHIDLLLA